MVPIDPDPLRRVRAIASAAALEGLAMAAGSEMRASGAALEILAFAAGPGMFVSGAALELLVDDATTDGARAARISEAALELLVNPLPEAAQALACPDGDVSTAGAEDGDVSLAMAEDGDVTVAGPQDGDVQC